MKSKAEKFVKNFGVTPRRKKYKGRYKTMAKQKGKNKYTRAQKRAYYSGILVKETFAEVKEKMKNSLISEA